LLRLLSMSNPTVDKFMTRTPHTIGQQQTLAAAHQLMAEFNVRHLPVLEAGKLVGVLSERDLNFVETLRSVDPKVVKVSEAMSLDIFTVHPKDPVRKIAAEMADHKYGSAIVVDGKQVVGVFTTIDGLRALSQLLGEK